MSRFFVGQRVRIVHPIHQEHRGDTGTVVRIFPERRRIRVLVNCAVAWDDGFDIPHTHTSRLEPLTPPHIAGSWEVIELLLPNIREGVAA